MSLPTAFHRLACANLAAQSAEQMALAAAPMIAVLALGAGAAETGLLSAAQSLPFLLLSLPAGLLADRMRRRRLMSWAEMLRALALAALPLLLWTGHLSLTVLALVGAATTTGTVVFSVAAPALVPSLVPRAALAEANTRMELARSLAFTAGPPLAGAIVGWFGGDWAFMMAAGLSVLAAMLLSGITETATAPGPKRHILADLGDGLRFVRRQSLLMAIMRVAIVWNTAWFCLQSVYVLYAVKVLGLSAADVGLTLGAFGIGMLAGAMAAPLIARHMRLGRFILLGPLGSLLASLTMLASLGSPGLFWPMVSYVLFGFFPILWTIGQTTLRQALTPQAMLGRISALFLMVGFGARPLGAALGGLVGETLGLGWAIGLSSAFFAVQALIVATSAIPRLEKLPEPQET